MTDIRKAAQAALEAMDSHPDNSRRSFRAAADGLRAALAQPEPEPEPQIDGWPLWSGLPPAAQPEQQAVHQQNLDAMARAADMLTAYAELIKRDGASHVEEHHYIPDVEWVANELRSMAAHPPAQPAPSQPEQQAATDQYLLGFADGAAQYAQRARKATREIPAQPEQQAEPKPSDCRPYGDLRNAKWLDPERYGEGACQSLKFKAAHPPAQPEQQAGPLVTLLAEWEDKNGTLAGITLSEWIELHQAATDAAVIESPRMLRNRMAHPPAQPAPSQPEQQAERDVLETRAAELHEGCQMPMEQARELAASEASPDWYARGQDWALADALSGSLPLDWTAGDIARAFAAGAQAAGQLARAELSDTASQIDERAIFEAWAGQMGFCIHHDADDEKYRDYHRATTRFAWQAWQARAAHPPAQPQADTIAVPRDLMDSIQEILRCTDSSVDWPIIDAVDALLAGK